MTTQTTQRVHHRFTVDQYHEMVRAGILAEDDRVELIDGEVLDMAPIGPNHSWGVARAVDVFTRVLRESVFVWVQSSIFLDEYGEPEPDLVLLPRRLGAAKPALPRPADVLLVMEVADSSLAHDRTTKALLYARAGIPEYWLEDVTQDALMVHRDPTPEGYRSVQTLRRGDHVAPLAFPDRAIAVTEILGEA